MYVGQFVNLVWHWYTEGADENEIRKAETRLYRPPVGEKATMGPWTAEAETAAFKALKAALGK